MKRENMAQGGGAVKEKLQKLAEGKRFAKWFQRDNLIIIILSGILLLIIALPSGNAKQNGKEEASGQNESQKTNVSAEHKEQDSQWSQQEYEQMLESRLESILQGMAGAGKVEVMITFSSSKELVVEKDRPVIRSNTTENDGEGGSRTIYQMESGEATVYRSEDSDSEPYVVKTLTPRVEGVLVAAQGAGTGEVTKNITEAVQALFDLEAHKIKVIRMKSSQ